MGAPGQQLEEAGTSEVRPSLQVLTLVQVVSSLTSCSEQSLCSYRDPGDNGRWVPLSGEEPLQRAWWDSAAEPEGLWLPCWVRLGRARARVRVAVEVAWDLPPGPGHLQP